MAFGDLALKLIISAVDKSQPAIKGVRNGVESVAEQLKRTEAIARRFIDFSIISKIFGKVGDILKQKDALNALNAELKIAADTNDEFQKSQQGVIDITRNVQGELGKITKLYISVSRATKVLGESQESAFSLTQTIAEAISLTSKGVAQDAAAILQFTQALDSGVLRGDEFNSVMENSIGLATALADGLGVPVTALRTLAEQGELTSDRLIEALKSQQSQVAEQATQLPDTIGKALNLITLSFQKYISQSGAVEGASNTVIAVLKAVANNIDALVIAAGLAAFAYGASLVIAFGKYVSAVVRSAVAIGQKVRQDNLDLITQQKQLKVTLQLALIRAKATAAVLKQIRANKQLSAVYGQSVSNVRKLERATDQYKAAISEATIAQQAYDAAMTTSTVATGRLSGSVGKLGSVFGKLFVIGIVVQSVSLLLDTFGQFNDKIKIFSFAFQASIAKVITAAGHFFSGDFIDDDAQSLSSKIDEIDDKFAALTLESLEIDIGDFGPGVDKAIDQVKKLQAELARLQQQRRGLQTDLTKAVEEESAKRTDQQIKDNKKVVESLEKDINKSIALQKKLSDEIEQRQKNISGIQQTAADKLRDIQRQSLSDTEFEADLELQILEELDAARVAARTDPEEAARRAKKAEQLAQELGFEDTLISTIEQSRDIRIDAERKAIAIAEEKKVVEEDNHQQLLKRLEEEKKNIADLIAQKEELNEPVTLTIESNINDVSAQIDELQEKLNKLGGSASISGAAPAVDSGSPDFSGATATLINSINNSQQPDIGSGGPAISEPTSTSAQSSVPSNVVNITLPSGQTFGPFSDDGQSSAALKTALSMEVLKRGRRS